MDWETIFAEHKGLLQKMNNLHSTLTCSHAIEAPGPASESSAPPNKNRGSSFSCRQIKPWKLQSQSSVFWTNLLCFQKESGFSGTAPKYFLLFLVSKHDKFWSFLTEFLTERSFPKHVSPKLTLPSSVGQDEGVHPSKYSVPVSPLKPLTSGTKCCSTH